MTAVAIVLLATAASGSRYVVSPPEAFLAPATPAQAPDAADAAEGMNLYLHKGDCQACHGWAADGRKMDTQMPDGANLRTTRLNRELLLMTIKCGRPGKGMPAYEDELFGPVAAVIPVRDEAEAIAIANNSVFGLGGGVITRDLARGERIAAEMIESGCVFVNDAVRSDPRLPFGGVKESGYGRELLSYGIKEFVNIKTVVIA